MRIWGDFIDGILGRLAGSPEAAAFLPGIAALKARQPAPGPQVTPPALPVQRYWPLAGADDPLGALTATLDRDLGVAWRQNPNYVARPPSPAFLENYGYLECAGPEAPYRDEGLRLGLLVLGPRTLYPPHHHPGEEIYLPLGPGRWLKGEEGWCDRPAGSVIHHPPHCPHGTESGALPLAALYLWRGEIVTAAKIG